MKGIQDTTSITYRQLMGNGLKYEIPKFQRDYTWEIEQWDDLWHDIKTIQNNEESDHYMGYLVLQSPDNKNYQVIDGQQRLTTLSIIILVVLKCLQDLSKKNIDAENNNKRIELFRNSYIGFLDPVTLIPNNKLKLNRNCDDYYRQYLVLLKELPIRNINSSEKSMKECFYWYYDKIKKEFSTGENLAGFIDFIADKLFFTRITVSDEFNAFRVFETLNARGVQLSASDLLKNYLFSVVDKTKPHISEIDELELLWSKVIGKLSNYKFEDYLRYYWNSKNKTVRKTALFKTIRRKINDKSEVFNILRELNDTADLFIAFQKPEDEMWKNHKELAVALKELKLFNIKQTLSLFISGYRNLNINEFIKLVKSCSIISFRYNVISGLNPNEQEEIYNSLAIEIYQSKKFNINSLKAIYVSDEEFETAFSHKIFKNTDRNNKIVKYIYGKIERYKFKNEIPYESDSFSVEHILPESPLYDWDDFDNVSLSRSIYRLGNLALLEKKLNMEAGNLSYNNKKNFYRKSNVNLTKEIPENFESWNEANIIYRQKDLYKYAKSIWRLNFI